MGGLVNYSHRIAPLLSQRLVPLLAEQMAVRLQCLCSRSVATEPLPQGVCTERRLSESSGSTTASATSSAASATSSVWSMSSLSSRLSAMKAAIQKDTQAHKAFRAYRNEQ